MGLGVALSTLMEGFLAPLRAAARPGVFFERLSGAVERYGIYFTALFYVGAWLWASALAFVLSLGVYAIRGAASLSLGALISAPLKALAIAIATPLVAALLDSLLIAAVIAFSPRRKPLHTVFLVRVSSLLPYTLRAPLVAALGGGPLDLAAVQPHPLDAALLAVGVLLTAYGLHRSMGAPLPHSLAAAAVPALFKALLGVASG